MDRFRIEGGKPLSGTVRISGAKNAALPAMTAALLTPEPVHLQNIPRVRDIVTMGRLLAHMNARVETPNVPPTDLTITAEKVSNAVAPYELVRTMRASILTLGPLMARLGRARVSLPGGCAIGARPVNLHVKALESMGAEIATEHGYVEAQAPRSGRLRGAHIVFEKITVTGTENILMAATLAEGETRLDNAAREPEVTDLVDLLIKMGAQIEGAGTSCLRVRGVERLHGATAQRLFPTASRQARFSSPGPSPEAKSKLTDCAPEHLAAVLAKLRETGVEIHAAGEGRLQVRAAKKLVAADVTTEEYPAFATDMQAQFMALATQAEGASVITETIFENRFMHASEMVRMGADIAIDGRQAIVRGPTALQGTGVIASDLRASASLVLAALVARGQHIIDRVYHIDRGYESIEEKLSAWAHASSGCGRNGSANVLRNDCTSRLFVTALATKITRYPIAAAIACHDNRANDEIASATGCGIAAQKPREALAPPFFKCSFNCDAAKNYCVAACLPRVVVFRAVPAESPCARGGSCCPQWPAPSPAPGRRASAHHERRGCAVRRFR